MNPQPPGATVADGLEARKLGAGGGAGAGAESTGAARDELFGLVAGITTEVAHARRPLRPRRLLFLALRASSAVRSCLRITRQHAGICRAASGLG